MARAKLQAPAFTNEASARAAMEDRPKLAEHIGKIVSLWSDYETLIGLLLALTMQSDAVFTTGIYLEVRSDDIRRKIVDAAVSEKLPEDLAKSVIDFLSCPQERQGFS
jgi:hypothetical protein